MNEEVTPLELRVRIMALEKRLDALRAQVRQIAEDDLASLHRELSGLHAQADRLRQTAPALEAAPKPDAEASLQETESVAAVPPQPTAPEAAPPRASSEQHQPEPPPLPAEEFPALAAEEPAPQPPRMVVSHPRPSPTAPPGPPRPPRPAGPAGPGLRDQLRKVGLWPPSVKAGGEVELGIWWASRLGALFIVIFGVFFAMYIGLKVTPAIRFLQLVGLSVGLTALGPFVTRRHTQLGQAITAAGLALIYFSAYAAYGLEAVRITRSPELSAMAQYSVAVGILIYALASNREGVFSLAVFFGYVAAWFSFINHLDNMSLLGAAVLAVLSVALYVRLGWQRPYAIAIPGLYVIYAVVSTFHWSGARPDPHVALGLGYPLGAMLLFGAADLMAFRADRLAPHWRRRLLQTFSSSAAVLLGLVTALRYYHRSGVDFLVEYYYVFGGVLVAGAVVYYALRAGPALMHAYFVKGSALVTLGIVTQFEGRTLWICLLVESYVLLLSAWRSRLRIVEAAMAVTWLASVVFVMIESIGVMYGNPIEEGVALFSHKACWLLYLAASAVLLCLQARLFGGRDEGESRGCAAGTFRPVLNLFYAAVFVVPVYSVTVAIGWPEEQYAIGLPEQPFIASALMIVTLLGLIAAATKHWIPIVSALPTFFMAHAVLWTTRPTDPLEGWMLWRDGVGLIVLSLLAAFLIARCARRHPPGSAPADNWTWVEFLLHVLWAIDVAILGLIELPVEGMLLLVVLASFGAAWLAASRRFLVLADASFLPVFFGLLFGFFATGYRGTFAPVHVGGVFEGAVIACFAIAAAWLWALAVDNLEELRRPLAVLNRRATETVHGLLATAVTLVGLFVVVDGRFGVDGHLAKHIAAGDSPSLALIVVWALAGLAAPWLSGRPGFRPAWWLAFFYGGVAAVALLARMNSGEHAKEQAVALSAVGVAACLAAQAFIAPMAAGRLLGRKQRQTVAWVHAAPALVLVLAVFEWQEGALEPYTTVFWGLGAAALFVAGLAGRRKPLRLVGLAGFACCIPRVFIVDTANTFHRIVAFGVLGVVLLIVGFLYSRFREAIERWDREGQPNKE